MKKAARSRGVWDFNSRGFFANRNCSTASTLTPASTPSWPASGTRLVNGLLSSKHLNRQQIERALKLAARVLIAGARSHIDSFLIHVARIFDAAELLQRLPAVKICGGVVRIVAEQVAKFA